MKAVLDRHYGFNKYYGIAEGCLWEGKKVGMYSVQDNDNLASFQTSEAVEGVKSFARKLICEVM